MSRDLGRLQSSTDTSTTYKARRMKKYDVLGDISDMSEPITFQQAVERRTASRSNRDTHTPASQNV